MKYTVTRSCSACGCQRMTLSVAKRGTVTLTCLGDLCGGQMWVKSPAGVMTLLELLAIPVPWKYKKCEQ